jgi:hypothetical protein
MYYETDLMKKNDMSRDVGRMREIIASTILYTKHYENILGKEEAMLR